MTPTLVHAAAFVVTAGKATLTPILAGDISTKSERATKRTPGWARRGFASMTLERRKEVAAKGGKTSQANKAALRYERLEREHLGDLEMGTGIYTGQK